MNELRSLAKEHNLRGYSRLRKADLINLLCLNVRVSPNAKRVPEIEHIEQPIEQPLTNTLTKRQLKRRRNKASKLSKKAKNLRIEIDDLKSQMDDTEYKVAKASSSTSARFKRKKIHSMKRETTKIAEKIKERVERLESLQLHPIQQPPKTNKRIKKKIEDINRKIRRAKGKTKRNLIAKRDALKTQLFDTNLTPKLVEGAFGGAYSRYRIDRVKGMDLPTFFSKTRDSILSILRRESACRAIRSQTTTWIRFMKGSEYVDLAFNSRMTPVYNLNDIDNIVRSMIDHMAQQVENPALRDSKFVFSSVIRMDISIHRLNLTRGSNYIPLPDWLSHKEAIINPKNSDMKYFKWAVIAALKWKEIGRDQQRVSKLRRYDDLDWDGINFTVSTSDIIRFEIRNQVIISINVLALDGKSPYICRKGGHYNKIVNLMIIDDGDK